MNYIVKEIRNRGIYAIIAEFMEKKDAISFARKKYNSSKRKGYGYHFQAIDTFNDIILYNSTFTKI